MLVIELRFLAGRYHATPWGRHVNEGVPEWPPSPYRLARAIFDAWKRKREEWKEDRVQGLLEKLATSAPLFRLPAASVSHTRSFLSKNTTDQTDKTLVFDGFVALQPDASVLVGWPELTLAPGEEADLNELLSTINFLGRSESWVSARVLPGITGVDWNCSPVGKAALCEEADVIPVAILLPRKQYEERPFLVKRGARRQGQQLSWLDAVTFSTSDVLKTKVSEPPALQLLNYCRPSACFQRSPAVRSRESSPSVQGVLYALDSKVLPPNTSTLEIAERVRAKLMGIHKALKNSPELLTSKFSGKDSDGKPLQGHRHIFVWPLDKNGDGRLDHLLVLCRQSLERDEQVCLDRLTSLWQSDGKPDLRCVPLKWGRLEDLLAPAQSLVSVTPFVPTHHYRRGRGSLREWLEGELIRECANHGFPAPVAITPIDRAALREGRSLRWLEFRRNRKEDSAQVGYGFRLHFAGTVRQPLALGYGAHFGLGLFVASPD